MCDVLCDVLMCKCDVLCGVIVCRCDVDVVWFCVMFCVMSLCVRVMLM